MLADGFHDVPRGKLAMVVTFLEMHDAPATASPIKAPQGITLRQVVPDLVWYRDIFKRVGALNWLWYGRLKLSDAALNDILKDPKIAFYTLVRDGNDEAMLELDFRDDGQCELAYFGVSVDLIGTGAGRYLMNEAIRLAWEQPIKRFHVHTCSIDSQQALSFYLRSGFTPYRMHVEIDDDPRLTGLLPETAAPHVPLIRP